MKFGSYVIQGSIVAQNGNQFLVEGAGWFILPEWAKVEVPPGSILSLQIQCDTGEE